MQYFVMWPPSTSKEICGMMLRQWNNCLFSVLTVQAAPDEISTVKLPESETVYVLWNKCFKLKCLRISCSYLPFREPTQSVWESIFIHSLVFSLRGRVGRNQSPVMWSVWLWNTASLASSWGLFATAFPRL